MNPFRQNMTVFFPFYGEEKKGVRQNKRTLSNMYQRLPPAVVWMKHVHD